MMVAQVYKYPENLSIVHLERMNFLLLNYISMNLFKKEAKLPLFINDMILKQKILLTAPNTSRTYAPIQQCVRIHGFEIEKSLYFYIASITLFQGFQILVFFLKIYASLFFKEILYIQKISILKTRCFALYVFMFYFSCCTTVLQQLKQKQNHTNLHTVDEAVP